MLDEDKGEGVDLTHDEADIADNLNDIASAGLTLGVYHGGTLADMVKGLIEVMTVIDEGNTEVVLIDVIFIIGRGENLGLIDVVNTDGLKNEGYDKVANVSLSHDWNGDGALNLLDEAWDRTSGRHLPGSGCWRGCARRP